MRKIQRVLIIDAVSKNMADPLHGSPVEFWVRLGVVHTSKEMSVGVYYTQGDVINCLLLTGKDSPRIEIYDFFILFLTTTEFKLEKVILKATNDKLDAVIAVLEFSDKNKTKQKFNLSVGDALVVALKHNAPVYAEKSLIDQFAEEGGEEIFKDPDIPEESAEAKRFSGEFAGMKDDELEAELKKALDKDSEDYEKASRIQKELKNRGKTS